MPRWLVALSYLAALSILIVSDLSMWVTLVFPVWVLVVSALILARSGLFEHLRAGHIQATPRVLPPKTPSWGSGTAALGVLHGQVVDT